ncbi:MAG: SGNH/GDSL hydrolase family protein [Solirubrobacteraceae bacterium]|nr:SGNH/GDSL hydrolase family protein [Solirubrobacteraceae bacterium]
MRFIALGDSLTAGIDETPPGTRWSDLLAERLRELHGEVEYENLAIFGLKSDEVVTTQLEAALAEPVDVASVICGGNDVMKLTAPDAGVFAEALEQLLGGLRERNPDALLITARLADLSEILPYRERSRVRVARATVEFNAVLDEIVERYDVRVLDLTVATQMALGDFLASDGFHPSIAGQKAIYEAMAAALGDEPLLAIA